jgi:integrase
MRAVTIRGTPGLYLRAGARGQAIWHIDKWIRGYGRLCESTGEATREGAERYLAKRLAELRDVHVYGMRPRRRWTEAVARYLRECAGESRIDEDARRLTRLESHLADKWLDEVHSGSLEEWFVKHAHLSRQTLLRELAPVRRILTFAMRWWHEPRSKLTWLAEGPLPALPPQWGRRRARKPYPLDWREEEWLLEALAPHLRAMARFMTQTGLREQELCGLRWGWEVRIPELDSGSVRRTAFVLPGHVCKNGEPRVLVLNDVAQGILEARRGEHPIFVFTYADPRSAHSRERLARMNSSGWRAARRRACVRYRHEMGTEPPAGFRSVRVHDLRHTFGRRLRAAGVPLDDRRDLLGHRSGDITAEYSIAEIASLLTAVNRLIVPRGQSAPTLLRIIETAPDLPRHGGS